MKTDRVRRWVKAGLAGRPNIRAEQGKGSAELEFNPVESAQAGLHYVTDAVPRHPYFCMPHAAMGMKGSITVQ